MAPFRLRAATTGCCPKYGPIVGNRGPLCCSSSDVCTCESRQEMIRCGKSQLESSKGFSDDPRPRQPGYRHFIRAVRCNTCQQDLPQNRGNTQPQFSVAACRIGRRPPETIPAHSISVHRPERDFTGSPCHLPRSRNLPAAGWVNWLPKGQTVEKKREG